MFNRQAFNRIGFNRATDDNAFSLYGSANIELNAAAKFSIKMRCGGAVNILLGSTAILTKKVLLISPPVDIILSSQSSLHKIMHLIPSVIEMELLAAALRYSTVYGSEISLPNLELGVGQELVIDTEKMTITIGEENHIMHLSNDSEFWQLQPGKNYIEYLNDNNTDTTIKILWKDRYL